jgi:hypothetical protein
MDALEIALTSAARSGVKNLWSNFLITVNTRIVPQNAGERVEVVRWMQEVCQELFEDFDTLNGVLIKPAGATNSEEEKVPDDGVVGVRARVGIEEGPDRGQLHCHILVEICHRLGEHNEHGMKGVHINRTALQRYFDERLPRMNIPEARRIRRVYLNNKLLTSGTDNSSKFMTLEYLNKSRDVHGRNLNAQRATASAAERRAVQALNRGEEFEVQP